MAMRIESCRKYYDIFRPYFDLKLSIKLAWDLNPGPSKLKSDALTITPQHFS